MMRSLEECAAKFHDRRYYTGAPFIPARRKKMRYSAMVAFEFEADGIMTAQKIGAAMARGAEEALGETEGSVRQVGCLELAKFTRFTEPIQENFVLGEN